MHSSTSDFGSRRKWNRGATLSLAFLVSCTSSGTTGKAISHDSDSGSGLSGSSGDAGGAVASRGAGGKIGSSGGTPDDSGSGGATSSAGAGGLQGIAGAAESGGATASGGTTASGGAGTGGQGGIGGAVSGTTPTMLPAAKEACPTLTSGVNTITLNGLQVPWFAWMGADKPGGAGGPIVVYWDASASDVSVAVPSALSQAALDEIQNMGGIVLAATKSSNLGYATGNFWHAGDIDFADQAIACALQQRHLDVRRIHVVGAYFGGMQAVYMWFVRSGYVASGTSYSGGFIGDGINGGTLQDPSHVAPVLAAHGSKTMDMFWANASGKWEDAAKQGGALAIDCDDGSSGFVPSQIAPQAWQFMKDHPFGAKPEPYTALPSGWPTYCSIK